MKKSILVMILIPGVVAGILWSVRPGAQVQARVQGAEQSFLAPKIWAHELTSQQGWGGEHPRMLADVNGDGKQDIVGFGFAGVWLATSNGQGFSPAFVSEIFGYNSGWRAEKHIRTVGDINGDGRDDIVAFGDAGVYRALSTGAGFGPATFVVANFGYDQGWRVDQHERLLADVNGDGRKDIVAFGYDGVWLSLATADGNFTAPRFVLDGFGVKHGWTPAKHLRLMADVNGDGRQDIVGFGDDGVTVALSTGTGFAAPQFVLAAFGYEAGGWRVDLHPRLMADVNNDGKQDIVAFGYDGVWTALAKGDGGFEAPHFVLDGFGYGSGWRIGTHPRFVADLNGDGYLDIVGFGYEGIYRALGGPGGFSGTLPVMRDLVVERGHPWNSPPNVLNDSYPRFVGDVNGDGKQDLVAFDQADIKVALSSNLPPPPPPAAPSNPRILARGTTDLYIAWSDNSNDKRRFFINYGKSATDRPERIIAAAYADSSVISSLNPDTQYCFAVQAESIWGVSAESPVVCGRTTPKANPTPTPTPTPNPTFVSAAIQYFDPGSEYKLLYIAGSGFKPLEEVSLKIVIKQGSDNPVAIFQQTTADSTGHIGFSYTGTGGGVCNIYEITTFQVQGTGLTSGKQSNVATAGC